MTTALYTTTILRRPRLCSIIWRYLYYKCQTSSIVRHYLFLQDNLSFNNIARKVCIGKFELLKVRLALPNSSTLLPSFLFSSSSTLLPSFLLLLPTTVCILFSLVWIFFIHTCCLHFVD